jgi:Bacterial pre-peptidase C-terminal domain
MAIRRNTTFNQAQLIDLTNGKQRLNDRLSSTNKNDFFRFVLSSRSSINLSLGKLKANANLQLLNSNGQIITQTSAPGSKDKALNVVLDPGTYHIRVYSGGRGQSSGAKTRYRLKAAAVLVNSAEQTLPPAAPDPSATPPETGITLQPAGGFRIQFDYRFDTQGWFTPERRAALEAAARVWESIILDEFPDTPVGTATPYVLNPETNEYAGAGNVFRTDTLIDDVTIFVGARSLGGSTLGVGAPSGHYTNESRYEGAKFEPWLGSIAFDTSTNWFFDPTPSTDNDIPITQNDFISTAVHEIGHILGFNRSANAFESQIVDNTFVGTNAMAANGGQPIPLQAGGAHIRDGYEFGNSGEALMDPTSGSGERQLPTVLDAAILNDVGYTINYNAVYRNQSINARTSTQVTYGRCGCLSCMGSTPLTMIGAQPLLGNPQQPPASA